MADRSITYEFRGNFRSLAAGLSASSRGVREFGNDLTGLEAKGEKMRRGLTSLGDGAGKFALVATGALAASAKAAIDWETAWAGVAKTVDGSASQMAALEGELRGLARTMPATHEEIAATAEAAGQLGVAREDIVDFTKTMLMLGETTNLTADQAATAIAQMANVMGTAPDEIDNLGATLVALGNNGASTEAQILEMAQRIAGAGAQIGLAESQVLAIANAVASAGIEAEAGGSAVSTAFTTMAKAASQGGPKLEKFAEVAGVSTTEFQRLFKETPAEAFVAFTTGLDQINKSGGDVFTTLQQVGLSDIRVSQAMLAMASSGDMLTESLDLGATSWQDNSALMEEFGKRAGTTASEMQVAWNNVKDAGIELGSAILPVLSSMSDIVTKAADAWQALPDPVNEVVASLLGVAAIGGGAFWFTSRAVSAIANTRAALVDLGMSSDSVRGKLTLLNAVKLTGLTAGLAIGIPLLSNDLDTLGRSIGDVTVASEGLEGVLEALNKTNVGKYADDLGIDMQKLAEDLYQNGESGAYVAEVYADLEKRLDSTGDNIKEAASYWIPGWTSEQNKAAEVTNGLNDVIADNADLMGTAEQSAKDAALAQSGLSGEARNLAESSSSSAEDVTALSEAMKKAQEEAQGAAQSFLDLSAGFNDGKFSFKEWITELEQSGRAVANFRKNADKALERGVPEGLVTSLQEMGAEGAVQLEHLANATPAQMKRIIAAWKRWERQSAETSNAIANDLVGVGEDVDTADKKAKQFGNGKYVPTVDLKADAFNSKRRQVEKDVRGLDRERGNPFVGMNKAPFDKGKRDVQGGMSTLNGLVATPTISVNTSGATAAIRNLQSSLSAIRDKTIYINEITRGGRADGGTIRRYDVGGTVPGARMPYGDKVLTYLAPGEEVISNRYGQADRHRELLKAINSNRLANGGTVGLADGGTARRLPSLAFADLPAINLATASLKGLNRALRQSEKALDDEREQRDKVRDAMKSLRSDVTTGLRSDLFGEQSGNVWSMPNRAGSFNSILATLAADTRAGKAYKADVAALKKKGLDGGALKELLSSGSPEQVAMFADLSRSQLARFEAAFERRQQVTASAGQAAGAATFGKELAKQTREMRLVADRVERVEKAIKAEERALKAEHKKDRDHSKRGAGNGSRNRRRG